MVGDEESCAIAVLQLGHVTSSVYSRNSETNIIFSFFADKLNGVRSGKILLLYDLNVKVHCSLQGVYSVYGHFGSKTLRQ